MNCPKAILFVLCFVAFSVKGQNKFDFNNRCLNSYRQLMALENDTAKLNIEKEIKENPSNIIPYYLADYIDCLHLLFNGDNKEYDLLKNNQEKHINKIEQGDENSPWYRFCKANIYLHWALVHLRFGNNLGAGIRFRKSFLLLKENKEKFPNFEENNVLYGLEMALAGAIPENYQWISKLMGIKGNIKNGVSLLANYIEKHDKANAPMREEAMIYYVYLKFYLENEQQIAWHFLISVYFSEQNNLMRSFIKSNIALNYRKASIAEQILLTAQKQIKGFENYPILQYEIAEAMIMKLDFNATYYYQSFIKKYKGNPFIKDAWQKLATIAYLEDNINERDLCLSKLKNKGNALTDADKQANRFAEKPNWSIANLLKVRLLIDGGYYEKALDLMRNIDKKKLGNLSNKLEYNFRYGRLFEEIGNNENALLFYDATIKMGKHEKDYFAARSALQKGFIYEKQGKNQLAITEYTNCLSMRNHDMQSSIDQQAKAGLNRLGN